MSLALQQVEPILVKNSALDLAQPVYYGVFDSAQNVNIQEIGATSDSTSVSTYNLNPPSPYIAIDRRMYIKGKFTITFQGSDEGQPLLQSGFDALRAYPMSQCMSNMKVTINNSEFSLQVSEVLNEILRYQFDESDECSMTPNILDECQQYSDLTTLNRNVLASYGNKFGAPSRGGFVLDSFTNGNTTATVTFTVVEPIFVSPLVSHYRGAKALYGVQNMSASVVWQNLSRMWSHATGSGSNITSVSVATPETSILVKYLTPQPLKKIPKSLQYNYHTLEPHVKEDNTDLAPGASRSLYSNNIQFNSIPNKIYIYVKQRQADRTYLTSDAWLSIESVSITFANVPGQLANCAKQQLYVLNRENGNNQSWVAWSGQSTHSQIGATDYDVNGPAGPLCLRFGKDIGLPASSLAPGVSGIFQFAVSVNFTNRSDHNIKPALYVSEMYEGLVTVTENTALQQLSVLSQNDVLDVMDPATGADVPSVSDAHGELVQGGSWWSDFTSAARKAVPIVRQVRQAVQKYAPMVSAVAPEFSPYAQAIKQGADIAEQFGLGQNGGIIDEYGGKRSGKSNKNRAGVLIGGQGMSRADLRKRMRDL
jgi:hypothetical protein